jgi:uncharacterized protein
MKLPLLFFTLAICSSSASAVSFNCTKATTFAEKAVCSDALLSKLDDALAENYKGMLNSDFGNSQKSLKADQIKWIKSLNQCKDNQCVIDAYRKRVDETCVYGVVSGIHPECTMSQDIQ